MRLSRIIMALTVGLAVVAVPTVAAAAQPQPTPSVTTQPPTDYPPQPPVLTVTPTTVYVNETVQLRGAGFGPGEIVDISIQVNPVLPSITATANGDGRFTRSYTPTIEGTYTFTAVGRDTGRTASTTLRVLKKVKPTPSPTKWPHKGGWLPVTGDDAGTPLKVGGGLVGAGAVLMLLTLAWRRKARMGEGS
ncbi:hypothetical protein [Micromonospora sp. SH-82]|uniref:hypothetical protein n=1 Tax=Micromonospora sp. SH-82 TaxID=3132938 RepID=UPI003EBD6B65